MAAKTNLAQYWKNETLLTIRDWETRIRENAAMSKLTVVINLVRILNRNGSFMYDTLHSKANSGI